MSSEKLVTGHGDLNDRLKLWKRSFLLALKKKAKDAKTNLRGATFGSEKECSKAEKDENGKPNWLLSLLSFKNKHTPSALSASLQNIESAVLDNPEFLSSNGTPPSYYVPPTMVHLVAHNPIKEEALLKEVDALVRNLEGPGQLPSISWIHKANRLSISLQQSGFLAESIDLSRIWVPLMEKLYAQHKQTYASDMALSYHNFSCTLSAQKKHEEALTSMQSALEIRRSLNDADATFAQMYSSSLHGVAYCYNKLKRYKEALPYIEEAIAIREKLAASGARMYKFDLARSYSRLGHCISHVKSRDDCIEHYRKSLELYRDVGPFTRFEKASMAATLASLSYNLLKLWKPFEALPVVQEAVEMYKKLASDEPKVYSCCLGANVHNLRLCRIWVMYLKVYHSLKNSVGLSTPVRDV